MNTWIVMLIMGVAPIADGPGVGPGPPAVELGGVVYVALDALAGAMGGSVAFTEPGLPLGIRPLTVTVGEERWQFPNGGDRVLVVASKREVPLAHPVVFYREGYYVSAREIAPILGVEARTDGGLRVIAKGRTLELRPVPIDSPFHAHRVEAFKAVHRPVRTTATLRARTSLHGADGLREIPAGTALLVRREAEVDGSRAVVLSDCGPDFRSYVADARAVEKATEAGSLAGSPWEAARAWFDRAAEAETGLKRGEAAALGKTACLTVDLCWSLRPFEPGLMDVLRGSAEGRDRPAAPVLFLTGRWMEQHPGELHELIELSRRPGLDVTWGLHSFDHPKYGKFLNDYPRERLQADDLRQERLMLEWGIVPSVVYRFPGLIHDRERLRGILDLDLFPIDCDSWQAIVEQEKGRPEEDRGPFARPIGDGSIILVHGNGNEPAGIPPLRRWLADHPDWTLGPIRQFLPTGK